MTTTVLIVLAFVYTTGTVCFMFARTVKDVLVISFILLLLWFLVVALYALDSTLVPEESTPSTIQSGKKARV